MTQGSLPIGMRALSRDLTRGFLPIGMRILICLVLDSNIQRTFASRKAEEKEEKNVPNYQQRKHLQEKQRKRRALIRKLIRELVVEGIMMFGSSWVSIRILNNTFREQYRVFLFSQK
mgnify:CR=1 FL=1